MKIISILTEAGFERTQGLGYFSSIVPGGVASMYEKGEMKVTVGLYVYGLPPTLISPAPAGMTQNKVIEWVSRASSEEILEFILENAHRSDMIINTFE